MSNLLESTKLERLRVVRDADLVDRFESGAVEVQLTPGVTETSIADVISDNITVDLTPAVTESFGVGGTVQTVNVPLTPAVTETVTDATGVYLITITSRTQQAQPGETVDVNADVTNDADFAATSESIPLEVKKSTESESEYAQEGSVFIGEGDIQPGDTKSFTWSWFVDSNADTGTYDLRINSDDDTDTTTTDIVAPDFAITITGTNSPVVQGSDLTVDGDLSNNGDGTGDVTVPLEIKPFNDSESAYTQEDSVFFSQVSPNTTVSDTWTWSTQSSTTAQDYDARLTADDDTAVSTVTVSAIQTIDDFEDGDLSEYSLSDVGGSAYVDVTSDAAKTGSFGMEQSNNSANDSPAAGSFPGDGLPIYPQEGDTVEWWVKHIDPNAGPVAVFQVRAESTSENVDCRLSANIQGRDEIFLRHWDGSQVTTSNGLNPGLSHPEWYKYSLDFVSGAVELRVQNNSGVNVGTLNISPSINDRDDWGINLTLFSDDTAICYFDDIVKL
jgi:hypothetical protein